MAEEQSPAPQVSPGDSRTELTARGPSDECPESRGARAVRASTEQVAETDNAEERVTLHHRQVAEAPPNMSSIARSESRPGPPLSGSEVIDRDTGDTFSSALERTATSAWLVGAEVQNDVPESCGGCQVVTAGCGGRFWWARAVGFLVAGRVGAQPGSRLAAGHPEGAWP